MMFSNVLFEDFYDEKKILSFYDQISKEFKDEDIELVWKYNSREVDTFKESNVVQIYLNYKKIFVQNSTNGRGALFLGNADGRVKQLLTAFKRSDLDINANLSSTYIKLGVYLLIVFGVSALQILPDGRDVTVGFLILFIFLLLVVGVIVYLRSFRNMLEGHFSLARTGSILMMIGFIGTALSSLFILSSVIHLNRSQFQKLLDNIE